MTTAQSIYRRLVALPESAQQEVLNFVQFLQQKTEQESSQKSEDQTWDELSICTAMKGMEEEQSLYDVSDIKETFQ